MPTNGRDERGGEVGLELGSECGGDEAEQAQIQALLERLRQLRRRIDEGRRLEADDRALLLAIVDEEMMERM